MTVYDKEYYGIKQFTNTLKYNRWNVCLNGEPEPYLMTFQMPCDSDSDPQVIHYQLGECFSKFAEGEIDCNSQCMDIYNYRDDLYYLTLKVIPDSSCEEACPDSAYYFNFKKIQLSAMALGILCLLIQI